MTNQRIYASVRSVTDEPQFTFLNDCPPFPPPASKRGQCKYPFERLDVGSGVDVRGRSLSTVKAAIRRWLKAHPGEFRFKVKLLSDAVRVRRER